MFECSVGDPSFYAEGMAIGRNKRWRGHSGQSEANEVQCSCRGICRGLRVMILDKEFKGAVAAYASLRSSRHKEKRAVCVCVRANLYKILAHTAPSWRYTGICRIRSSSGR